MAVPRHGKKYGNSAQNGCEKTSGQRSCGRDKTPPIRGLRKHGFSQRSRKETDGATESPYHWYQGETPRHIGFVCELRKHALYHADVSVQHAIQAATKRSVETVSFLDLSNIPKDKRPEGTGKAEQDD